MLKRKSVALLAILAVVLSVVGYGVASTVTQDVTFTVPAKTVDVSVDGKSIGTLTIPSETYTQTVTVTVPDPPPPTTTTPDPTPTPTPAPTNGFDFPASFHIWGGNSQQAMADHDFVISSQLDDANPAQARAAGNTGLVAMAHSSLPGSGPGVGFAWTYGGGLMSWTGDANLRAYSSSDNGCKQTDGLQGFKLDSSSTASFVRDAILYSWSYGQGSARGYNGVWSDNLFPSNLLAASWAYGSCGTTINTGSWDAGLHTIASGIKAAGIPLVGGNTVYRSTNNTIRADMNTALDEVLDITITQGADAFARTLGEVQAWQSQGSGPKYLAVMDHTPSTDTARMRFGLSLSMILGGAYMPYQSHADLYEPAEMTRNGQRHYCGQPTSTATRSSTNVFVRTFEHCKVTGDFGTHTGTIAYTG